MIALSNAAVIRWQPFGVSWRDGTFLAKSYLRNWSRTQHVQRAVPLSLEDLLGFCGFHALFGRWHVVGALCVGFLCLLRTGETLKAGQITLSVDSGVALLALPASKGARALLAFLCRGCSPQDQVFLLSFEGLASALVTAAAAFGYRSSDLLPCSLDEAGLLSTSLVLGPWI